MTIKLFCTVKCDHCEVEAQAMCEVKPSLVIGDVELPAGWSAHTPQHYCGDSMCQQTARERHTPRRFDSNSGCPLHCHVATCGGICTFPAGHVGTLCACLAHRVAVPAPAAPAALFAHPPANMHGQSRAPRCGRRCSLVFNHDGFCACGSSTCGQ